MRAGANDLEWLRLRVRFATEEWANGCISSRFTKEDKGKQDAPSDGLRGLSDIDATWQRDKLWKI
jgi:hypothetical protein